MVRQLLLLLAFTGTAAAQTCVFTISPSSVAVARTGGSATISINGPSTCQRGDFRRQLDFPLRSARRGRGTARSALRWTPILRVRAQRNGECGRAVLTVTQASCDFTLSPAATSFWTPGRHRNVLGIDQRRDLHVDADTGSGVDQHHVDHGEQRGIQRERERGSGVARGASRSAAAKYTITQSACNISLTPSSVSNVPASGARASSR